jgi:hypothetical protein
LAGRNSDDSAIVNGKLSSIDRWAAFDGAALACPAALGCAALDCAALRCAALGWAKLAGFEIAAALLSGAAEGATTADDAAFTLEIAGGFALAAAASSRSHANVK